MGDAQPIQTPQNFELRNRKASPPKDTLETITVTDSRLSTSEADPQPSIPGEPSLVDFRTLIVTNANPLDVALSLPSSPDQTLFYVKNGSLQKNTPSVTLSSGTKEGRILGTVKLGWGRDNTVGLGNPEKDQDIVWENLKRVSEWTHATYEFSFMENGDKKTYVWQRTKQRLYSDQPNMELKERLMGGMGDGEVLAVYKGNQGLMWKSRGQFWIRKDMEKASKDAEQRVSSGGGWSDWELMVLLTGLGIIESSRRRSRARRSGGVAGAVGGG